MSAQLLDGRAAAPGRFEQHAFDDLGRDAVGFKEFECGDGVAGFLDGNRTVHNITPVSVSALVRWFDERYIGTGVLVLIHRNSLKLSDTDQLYCYRSIRQ